jgi:hypothetical protein
MTSKRTVSGNNNFHALVARTFSTLAKKASPMLSDVFVGSETEFIPEKTIMRDALPKLFFLNIVLAVLYLGSGIGIAIWHIYVLPKMQLATMTTDYVLFDLGTSTFGVVLNELITYRVVIAIILPTFVAGIFNALQAFLIPTYDIAETDDFQSSDKRGAYINTVYRGVFVFRWIEKMLLFPLFIWIMAWLSGITNVYSIVSLNLIAMVVVGCAWAHEEWNRYLDETENERSPDTDIYDMDTIARWRSWLFFAVGALLNIWIMTMTFVYWGYTGMSAPVGVFEWWKWTSLPVIHGFNLIICVIMIYYTAKPDKVFVSSGAEEKGIFSIRLQRNVNKEFWLQLVCGVCILFTVWFLFLCMVYA